MAIQQWTTRLFKCQHDRAAQNYLSDISDFYSRYQNNIERKLARIKDKSDRNLNLGKTEWGKDIEAPISTILSSHGLILGATGSGKSYYALSLFKKGLNNQNVGRGILDPKGELFLKSMDHLIAHLIQSDRKTQERILKKLYIIDYANPNAVVPYNILALREGEPIESLINNRVDTICDLFTGSSQLTNRMRITLRYFLFLLTENKLPISFFDILCDDYKLIETLAHRSPNPRVKRYFSNRFRVEAKSTIYALRQRIDSLLSNENVRLSLSASNAPDFRKLMDDGKIVLITTSNPGISRDTSLLLQMFMLSDIRQSVFQRQKLRTPFTWWLDEAQWLYKHRSSRTNINDLLSMSRSFGTYIWLLTQSLSSAVTDSEIRNAIECNVRNILMLRSTLTDAKLLLSSLPVTGAMQKEKSHPLEATRFLEPKEEIKARTDEIPRLPDRVGYLWLKTLLGHSIRIKTPYVEDVGKKNDTNRSQRKDLFKRITLLNAIPKEKLLKELEEKENRLEQMSQNIQQNSEGESYNNDRTSNLVSILEHGFQKKRGGR